MRGATIKVTSQMLEVVETLCDDIALLNKGVITVYLGKTRREEPTKDSVFHEILEKYVEIKHKNDVVD